MKLYVKTTAETRPILTQLNPADYPPYYRSFD